MDAGERCQRGEGSTCGRPGRSPEVLPDPRCRTSEPPGRCERRGSGPCAHAAHHCFRAAGTEDTALQELSLKEMEDPVATASLGASQEPWQVGVPLPVTLVISPRASKHKPVTQSSCCLTALQPGLGSPRVLPPSPAATWCWTALGWLAGLLELVHSGLLRPPRGGSTRLLPRGRRLLTWLLKVPKSTAHLTDVEPGREERGFACPRQSWDFFLRLYVYLTKRSTSREKGRGRSRLPDEQGAPLRAWS